MKIIGLDVGEKRIGVAKVDSSTRIAIPVGFVNADGSEWQEIASIARLQGTNFFVVGLPRSNEGVETKQSLYARNFAKTLVEKIPGAKIRFQDESLTSVEAEKRLKSRKKKFEKGDIDAEAASIILQDFIENFNSQTKNNALENPKPDPKEKKNNEQLSGVKAVVKDAKDAATNLTKKEMDKAKLKTRKAKHKMKTITKFATLIAIALLIASVATIAILLIKEARNRERAEYYAQLEAEMAPEVFEFEIKPGETIFDVEKALTEVGYSAEEVEQALNASYDYDFLKERPEGASLEGYLFGEKYEFYKTDSVETVIKKFLDKMGEVITENNLKEKYSEQGLTLFEGITLASVVQKEAKTEDRPTVAQVFLSRLENGIMLGSDVTVSYALDKVDPDRQTYKDNQSALKIDSCYNTRVYRGLPCGPISNPGLSSLLAVANPSDTAYLYFLTGDDGVMYYSYTEYEHNQKAYQHCKELCNTSL